MSRQDFPPYSPEEDDRTVLIPRPGGRGSRQRNKQTAAPARSPLPLNTTGLNNLVSAAAPILSLIPKLRSSQQHQDIEQLRNQILQEVNNFEQVLRSQGTERNIAHTARYLLCAVIDETVLNTIWGSESSWSYQGLLSTLYKETSGGERFFSIVGQLMQDPQSDLSLMELSFICISLGFQGRYRPMSNGQAKLEDIRHRLFEIIRQRQGEFPQELSLRWQIHNSKGKALRQYIPVWVVAAVAGAILVCVFLGFSLVLESNSNPVYQDLENLAIPNIEMKQ